MPRISADTSQMTEGPYPNVPALTGPVSGIANVGAIGAQPRRREGKRPLADQDRPTDEAPAERPPTTVAPATPPPPRDPLIEALDRLRATDPERDVRSADTEVLRLLRAKHLYGDGLSGELTPATGQSVIAPTSEATPPLPPLPPL